MLLLLLLCLLMLMHTYCSLAVVFLGIEAYCCIQLIITITSLTPMHTSI
jgi:hypothetical protein